MSKCEYKPQIGKVLILKIYYRRKKIKFKINEKIEIKIKRMGNFQNE